MLSFPILCPVSPSRQRSAEWRRCCTRWTAHPSCAQPLKRLIRIPACLGNHNPVSRLLVKLTLNPLYQVLHDPAHANAGHAEGAGYMNMALPLSTSARLLPLLILLAFHHSVSVSAMSSTADIGQGAAGLATRGFGQFTGMLPPGVAAQVASLLPDDTRLAIVKEAASNINTLLSTDVDRLIPAGMLTSEMDQMIVGDCKRLLNNFTRFAESNETLQGVLASSSRSLSFVPAPDKAACTALCAASASGCVSAVYIPAPDEPGAAAAAAAAAATGVCQLSAAKEDAVTASLLSKVIGAGVKLGQTCSTTVVR